MVKCVRLESFQQYSNTTGSGGLAYGMSAASYGIHCQPYARMRIAAMYKADLTAGAKRPFSQPRFSIRESAYWTISRGGVGSMCRWSW
jgi:hypothetical protein